LSPAKCTTDIFAHDSGGEEDEEDGNDGEDGGDDDDKSGGMLSTQAAS
jgi:hypothetical protein